MNKVITTSILCAATFLTACGGGQSSNSTATSANNKVYIPHATTTDREDLWETDGTTAGTTMVHDFSTDFPLSSYDATSLYGFINHQDNVYYNASVTQNGGGLFSTPSTHLYSTNIANGGYATQLETSVKIGYFSATNHKVNTWQNIVNDDLYMISDDPNQLSSVEGTISKIDNQGMATDMSYLIPNNVSIMSISDSARIGGDLYFAGRDTSNYYIVKLDTVNQVFTTHTIGSVFPNKMFVMGTDILIHGGNVTNTGQGSQLFSFDTIGMSLSPALTTLDNTVEVMENTGVVVGNELYFASRSNGGSSSSRLYVYNHTNTLVTSLGSIPYATGLTEYNGMVLFSEGLHKGAALWQSDGTVAGTKRIKDASGNDVHGDFNFTKANGELYFTGTTDTQQGDLELWKYNSATASANRVMDINVGLVGSAPSHITELNGGIVFQAAVTGNGSQRNLVSLTAGVLTTLN